jgi:uncharacterized DUF497 family protein
MGLWDWIVVSTITVPISFDPKKRLWTLEHRELDFLDAQQVFEGVTYEIEDNRRNYGEKRTLCFGWLGGRMVMVRYTLRGADRHVFSMRKVNEREYKRIRPYLV